MRPYDFSSKSHLACGDVPAELKNVLGQEMPINVYDWLKQGIGANGPIKLYDDLEALAGHAGVHGKALSWRNCRDCIAKRF